MPEHEHYDEQDLFNRDTHHESSDVPIRPLWWAVGIFIVFAIVTHIVLGFFYKAMVVGERRRMDPPQTTIQRGADADVPQNQPLLQPFPRLDGDGTAVPPQAATPVADMDAMRAEEDRVLKSYAWVDKQRGVVRIPIEEAKAVMAARLAVQGQLAPVAPAAATTTAPPVVPGSEPSPAGTAVPPDTGVAPPATTNTSGGNASPAATNTAAPAATTTTGGRQ